MIEYIKHYFLRWQLIILYENTTKSCKKKTLNILSTLLIFLYYIL